MSDTEKRRLLKVRKKLNQSRPKFHAFESWRFVKIKPRWRKPRGIDNKMRTNEKGWPKVANIGWGGPSAVRGLHPSGKEEVLIQNANDLTAVDKENQVATHRRDSRWKEEGPDTGRGREARRKDPQRRDQSRSPQTSRELEEEKK